jgi:hypothetical protein
VHHPRRERAQLVTEARRSRSDDIAYRQRRYLIMMGVRALCFVAAVLMFVNHLGWLTAIPAIGAIIIPYFAVIFANGGREPNVTRGFRAYEPGVPVPYTGPQDQAGPGTEPGSPGTNGASRHNG